MKPLLFCLFLCSTYALAAQTNQMASWKIGFTNSQTARPFAKLAALFQSPFHPGIEIGYMRPERSRKKSQWVFEPAISYTFHRWVQHNIAIMANQYYRHNLPAGFKASARVGAGYQLSIPTTKVYSISNESIKAKAFAGRSQLALNAALGVDKSIGKNGILIGLLYQQKIQTPFVKNYVPLLPYNSMMISCNIPVHRTVK